MSDPFRDKTFPAPALWAASLLLLTVLVGSALGHYGDLGTTRIGPSEAVAVAQLQFIDRSDGGIEVRTFPAGLPVANVEPGGDGFVRGVLRGLARERKREALDRDLPYEIARYADGRLTVRDPATDRAVDLGAFGPTNFGAFRALFESAKPIDLEPTHPSLAENSL